MTSKPKSGGHGKSKRAWRYNPYEVAAKAPPPPDGDTVVGMVTAAAGEGGWRCRIPALGVDLSRAADDPYALLESLDADWVLYPGDAEPDSVPAVLRARAAAVPLYGLILSGGKSERMGQDKALMQVGGETQMARAGRLLAGLCERVFVSARQEQAERAAAPWPVIADSFLGLGPMGGILSAQRAHPEAAWLVMACDLPYVTAATLAALLDGRNPFRYATAFQSSSDGFPEPLCAVWEPKSHYRMLHFLGLGYNCPRKVLINSRIQLLRQADPRWLDNVNTPAELDAARRDLG